MERKQAVQDDDSMTITTENTNEECCKCCSHKCWSNGRCCFCLKCMEKPLTQYQCYTIINIFRFLAIAALIVYANDSNKNTIEKYRKDCCNCYYISKDPNKYSNEKLSDEKWFDLSMCVPTCTSCKFCDEFFDGSAQKSFNYSTSHNKFCPLPDYSVPKSIFSFQWRKKTQCHDRIAFTIFFWFTRTYTDYYAAAVFFIGLYIAVSIALVCLSSCKCCNCGDAEKEFSRIISIYNVIMGESCLYWIFVPYKYWNKPFKKDVRPRDEIICPITAVTDPIREWVDIMVIGLMILVLIHILMEFITYCNYCCCKQTSHVTQEQNQQLLETNSSYDIKHSKHYCCYRFRTLFGFIFGLWIVMLLIALTVGMCQIWYADFTHDATDDTHDGTDDTDLIVIITAVVLIVSSMFDSIFTGVSRKWLQQYLWHIRTESVTQCGCCGINSNPLVLSTQLTSLQYNTNNTT